MCNTDTYVLVYLLLLKHDNRIHVFVFFSISICHSSNQKQSKVKVLETYVSSSYNPNLLVYTGLHSHELITTYPRHTECPEQNSYDCAGYVTDLSRIPFHPCPWGYLTDLSACLPLHWNLSGYVKLCSRSLSKKGGGVGFGNRTRSAPVPLYFCDVYSPLMYG